MGKQGRQSYLAYTLSMTTIALLLLIGVTYHATTVGPLQPVDWIQVSFFLAIALVTRGMSLELLDIRVSLDTPIFVAGAFHFPPVVAAWLVFAGTAGFDLCRIAMERESGTTHELPVPWWFASMRSLFAGSVSAALLFLCALAIDGYYVVQRAAMGESMVSLYWLVPIFVLAWLPTQYLLVATAFRLLGRKWSRILREVLLPGFVSEVTLVPLAVLMVVIYDRSQPVKFLVLAFIAILFIFVLRRLTSTSKNLMARVKELEVLNAFGQMMSSTLDAEYLADRIADGVLSIYEEGELFALVRREGGTKDLSYLVYDGKGRKNLDPDLEMMGPIAQWIVETGMEVRGTITTHRGRRIAEGGWAGMPIVSCGEVIGALMVCTNEAEARSVRKMHLLQLLSRQAAVALENSNLYELATVDGLTGLFVRRYFDQRIDEEFHRASRYDSSFAVVMIDVDEFKAVNDTYLHATGDKVLQMVAAVIRNCIRAMDVPCRLGGDEFAIILPESNETDSCMVAERICKSVSSVSITVDGEVVNVTVSIGVASYPECDVAHASDMVEKVDVALYRSKGERGKNHVTGFSECA